MPNSNLPIRANALRLALALLALFVPGAWAQRSPTPAPVTNILQLVEAVANDEHAVRDVRLEATVCATSNPSMGVLILKDSTDAELVELGSGQPNLAPGDKIRIEQKNCLLRRRD